MTTTHSQLSPSKFHRVMACPGSVREEARFPDQPSGPAAVDGTHTHTLLEHVIRGHGIVLGGELKDDDGAFIVDQDRLDRVQLAIDYIAQRCEELGCNWSSVIPEQRVDPARWVGRDDMSGTCDVQIDTPSLLEIIDYKDGMGEVAAEDNPQLILYALGALDKPVVEWPDTIRMTIVQPKMALVGRDPISSWEVSAEELCMRIEQFKAAAAASDDPNAPLNPGESQCRFCKAKGNCKAETEYALKSVGLQFQQLAQGAAAVDANRLSDQQIREIVESAGLVKTMLDGVEEEATRRLNAGAVIPGLKLVRGRGQTKWKLTEDETADRLVKMGMPKSEVFKTSVITPTQAKKIKWVKKVKGEEVTKSLTERQLKTLETEYIEKSEGKLVVAPESDSRQAVVVSAAPLFSAATQEPELPAWLQ